MKATSIKDFVGHPENKLSKILENLFNLNDIVTHRVICKISKCQNIMKKIDIRHHLELATEIQNNLKKLIIMNTMILPSFKPVEYNIYLN